MDNPKNLTKKRTVIQLHVSQSEGKPSVFLWPLLPEQIINLIQSDSGGTNVTADLPKGEKVTFEVTEKLDQVKKAIEICKQVNGL